VLSWRCPGHAVFISIEPGPGVAWRCLYVAWRVALGCGPWLPVVVSMLPGVAWS